jgi:hypothetical protein
MYLSVDVQILPSHPLSAEKSVTRHLAVGSPSFLSIIESVALTGARVMASFCRTTSKISSFQFSNSAGRDDAIHIMFLSGLGRLCAAQKSNLVTQLQSIEYRRNDQQAESNYTS